MMWYLQIQVLPSRYIASHKESDTVIWRKGKSFEEKKSPTV